MKIPRREVASEFMRLLKLHMLLDREPRPLSAGEVAFVETEATEGQPRTITMKILPFSVGPSKSQLLQNSDAQPEEDVDDRMITEMFSNFLQNFGTDQTEFDNHNELVKFISRMTSE